MKLISCSPCKDSFRLDFGPSRGNHCTRAFRPIEAPKGAVCYGPLTSKPVESIGSARHTVDCQNAKGWRVANGR